MPGHNFFFFVGEGGGLDCYISVIVVFVVVVGMDGISVPFWDVGCGMWDVGGAC